MTAVLQMAQYLLEVKSTIKFLLQYDYLNKETLLQVQYAAYRFGVLIAVIWAIEVYTGTGGITKHH
jgi:hypothetical protein